MHTFSTHTSVKKGKRIELKDIPFAEGEHLEVLLIQVSMPPKSNSYPLRGLKIRYDAPTEPVAMEDWDALS